MYITTIIINKMKQQLLFLISDVNKIFFIYTHTRGRFCTHNPFRKKKNKITKTNKAKQAEKCQERWRNVFITALVLPFIGAFLLAVFGSREEQEWAKEKPSSPTSASDVTTHQNGDTSAADEKYADIGRSEDTGRCWAQV